MLCVNINCKPLSMYEYIYECESALTKKNKPWAKSKILGK